MSGRWVDTELERPRWRFTVNYRFHQRFQAGIELNPAAEEIGPLFNLFLLTETDRRPAVFLATSSDRIGSPAGNQSYFLTASKRFGETPLMAYASLNYSEWDGGFNVPFGAQLELGRGFSVRHMYDGDRSHFMANYYPGRWGVSLMSVWYERFGIAFSLGL